MATKSILKNINIKSKTQGNRFASALENAEKFKGKEVSFSRAVSEVRGESVKMFFGVKG